MKKNELLRKIGDIDEKYVEEASYSEEKTFVGFEKSDGKVERKVSSGKSRYFVNRWSRWVAGAAAAVILFTGGHAALNNMDLFMKGSSDSVNSYELSQDLGSGGGRFMQKGTYSQGNDFTTDESMLPTEDTGNGGTSQDKGKTPSELKQQSGVKLIYTADLGLETVDFDKTIQALLEAAKNCNAYIESSSVENGSYGDTDFCKNGSYVIRVPQGEYSKLIASMNEKFNVRHLSESVEDIGEQYFDTEARVETLKVKQQRLQQLLKEAKNVSDIIEIESALSDTEYQLEMYTSELKHYDGLIGYSTINVWVQEVERLGNGIDAERGFASELADSLKNGAIDFFAGLQSLLYGLAYHIITILIILVVAVISWKKKLIYKIRNCFRKK